MGSVVQVSGASQPVAPPLPAVDIAALTKVAVAADAANPATSGAAIVLAALPDPDPSKGGQVDVYA